MTIQGFVKHVLGSIYVFFTLFGHGCRVRGGGGVSQGICTQHAQAVVHPRPLKKRCFQNLFLRYCEHLICPCKICKAFLRHHSCVFYPVWVRQTNSDVLGSIYVFFTLFGHGCRVPGGGVSQGIRTQHAQAVVHPRPLKKRCFQNLFFPYCEHLICPCKVYKAFLRHHSCVFYPVWVRGGVGWGVS